MVRVLFRLWRRLNPEIVFGFLIATLFWIGILGWQAAYAPTEMEKQKCYEAAQKSGHKSEECKSLWERTTSDPVAFFTLWLVIFTGGLTVSTVLLWRAGEKQFRHARRTSIIQSRDMQASIAISHQAADAARKGARAAEASATALIDAERAHIYAVIEFSSVDTIGVLMLDKSVDMKQPFKFQNWYSLVNHGKSPAIITQVVHGFAIEKRVEKREFIRVWQNIMDARLYVERDGAMEIVEVGKKGFQIDYSMDPAMPLEDAKALTEATSPQALFFYGVAYFGDSFGHRYVAMWEYMLGGDRRWQLMAHKESKQG